MKPQLSLVAVIVCLVVAVQSAPPSAAEVQRMMKYASECSKEMRIAMTVVGQVQKGAFDDVKHDGKCLIHCVMVKRRLFNQDGTPNMDEVEAMLASMDPDDAAKVKECHVELPDPCEKSFSILKCHHKVTGMQYNA